MISLNEIKQTIILLLREHTEVTTITGEDIIQAIDKESQTIFPILQVQLEPIGFHTAAAGTFTNKSIFVDISYMEELHTSHEHLYDVLEKVDGIFRPFFKCKNRFFTVDGSMNITDDIGHYVFTIYFTDILAVEKDDAPLAGDIEISFRKDR